VHANDQVNMSQSSNDVVPTAIHVAAALLLEEIAAARAQALREVWRKRAAEFGDIVKTGRTHLMDAMPITVAQELAAGQAQIDAAERA
jgi:fumarate hydratase class II